MSKLQKRIVDMFLQRLAESGELDANKLAQLKVVLSAGKKVRADDLVRVFSLPEGSDVK